MTNTVPAVKKVGKWFQFLIDILQAQKEIRGWPYLLSWGHRVSGIILVLYVWFHIMTLSALHNPVQFDANMKILGFGLFVFLEWLLALPVIYHALNGGRLILYETFQNRRDDIVRKWVIILSTFYVLLLSIFMMIGNQTISAPFFWVYAVVASGCAVYIVVLETRRSGASLFWKLQRISGAFLLLMVPAHMLFMHLNPAMGHDSQIIISRMDNPLIKVIDFMLMAGVLFHGAYGLNTISQDYIVSQKVKTALVVLIAMVTLVFAWIGLKLIVMI